MGQARGIIAFLGTDIWSVGVTRAQARTAICALIAALPLIAEAQTYASGSRPEVVLIGCEPQITWAPLVAAKEKKFFEREGLDVRVLVFPNADSMFSAFCRPEHHIHFAAGKVGDLVLRAAGGRPVSLVCEIGASQGLDKIFLKSGYKGLHDPALRGKRIACKRQTMSHYLLAVALQTYQLKLDDFDVMDMNPWEAASAFIAGRVDGAVTREPYAKIIHKKGHGKVAFTSADIKDRMPEGLCAQDYLIQQYPDIVVKVLRGWFGALRWSEENQNEYLDIADRRIFFRHRAKARDMLYYEHLVNRYRPATISQRMQKSGPVFAYCEDMLRFYRSIGAIGAREAKLENYRGQKLLIDNQLFREAIDTYSK